MTIWTDRAWFTVQQAAEILRVHTDTLYDACASGDFPCSRWGGTSNWFIRIPAEALRMRVRPETQQRSYHLTDDPWQLELPLDVSCLIPVRRYRNTREVIGPWAYEDSIYLGRVRRVSEPLRARPAYGDDQELTA